MWAALMIPTFLFLSLFSVGCAQDPVSTTDGSDNYPILWDQINGSITEFPVQNNKIIIDIWKYIDRLKMYKILMRESDKYFAQFGKNNSENVLWTLTILYGRLYKTDRFSDPSNSSVCAFGGGCISSSSGWGGINFYVIAMNFLAAVESGFLRDIPYKIEFLSGEERRSDFCYSIEECRRAYPQAMDVAKRFYQYMQSKMTLSKVGTIPINNGDDTTVIKYMWDAHQAAIDVAKPKFNDISEYSSATERDFTMDFLTVAEFCEAAEYRPYFGSTVEILLGFPHRPLTDQDANILAPDFNLYEKAHLTSIRTLSRVNKMTACEVGSWRMMMYYYNVNMVVTSIEVAISDTVSLLD
ncbi:protein LEG1 homolog [Oryctolagus cuniculus]|uniref:protein LEG1 homolog n=1 Tax=Oryctolagus cuniculus TaxID=9986 RepID=UPI00387A09A8